jgi:hypothetical protein
VSVSFCVGTGRCGTTFLYELARREPAVAASHERLRLAATFHMYCQWYGVPVDPEGFLVDRERVIAEDLADHAASFEASALLSHSLAALHGRFDARVLLLVRHPAATVASFAARGWFAEAPERADAALPPSYREGVEPRHFFGRILPRGREAYARWAALTPIGRIAWFWAARNGAILEQMRALPADRVRVERLEALDHERYGDVAAFLGWRATLGAADFAALAASRPNTGPNRPVDPAGWSARERAEYGAEVARVAEALGYELGG